MAKTFRLKKYRYESPYDMSGGTTIVGTAVCCASRSSDIDIIGAHNIWINGVNHVSSTSASYTLIVVNDIGYNESPKTFKITGTAGGINIDKPSDSSLSFNITKVGNDMIFNSISAYRILLNTIVPLAEWSLANDVYNNSSPIYSNDLLFNELMHDKLYNFSLCVNGALPPTFFLRKGEVIPSNISYFRFYYYSLFSDEYGLTAIALNRFQQNGKLLPLTSLVNSFNGNILITGAVPELWNIPEYCAIPHTGCFAGCVNASNYAAIPSDWK